MWCKLADFFFPRATPFTKEELVEHKCQLDKQLKDIEAVDWGKCSEVALEYASKLAESEAQRRRTAESKATIYLAVITALVPLVLTVQAAAWEEKVGPAPSWLRLILLSIAVVYISAAAFYAFRTLEVTVYNTLGISDLIAAWRTRKTTNRLVKSILSAVRESQSVVNAKVTQIKLTHLHMIRALVAFVGLLLIDPVYLAVGQTGLLKLSETKPVYQNPDVSINVSIDHIHQTIDATEKVKTGTSNTTRNEDLQKKVNNHSSPDKSMPVTSRQIK